VSVHVDVFLCSRQHEEPDDNELKDFQELSMIAGRRSRARMDASGSIEG
jgi:hypothetical protein